MLQGYRCEPGADSAQYESLIAEVEVTYTPPPLPEPVVPVICTPAQGLVALFAIKGVTEADVSAAIAAIPESLVPEYG